MINIFQYHSAETTPSTTPFSARSRTPACDELNKTDQSASGTSQSSSGSHIQRVYITFCEIFNR